MQQFQGTFLAKIVPAALASQEQFGIPASVTIAQAILESGWGQSKLARDANNFFGVKARAGEPFITLPTMEFQEGQKVMIKAAFAAYPSPEASFLAHGKLIFGLVRYGPAMQQKSDPRRFATSLRCCGYSTNPTYEDSLMQLVSQHDLTQYDVRNPPAVMQA